MEEDDQKKEEEERKGAMVRETMPIQVEEKEQNQLAVRRRVKRCTFGSLLSRLKT